MSRIGKSARGESVDFDLIAIKQQLMEQDQTIEVSQRKDYVDIKDGVKKVVKKTKVDTIEEPAVEVDEGDQDEFLIDVSAEQPKQKTKTRGKKRTD